MSGVPRAVCRAPGTPLVRVEYTALVDKLPLPVRTGMMLAGILLIGVSVALYRLAAFGVDPFTGMNLGISTFLGWSFGNW